jgi:benzoate-CoA ligase family protein
VLLFQEDYRVKASDLPIYYNAVDILERNLPVRADKSALLSADRELTFGQVSEEVNRAGNALHSLGVRMGDMVAILAPDCAEWVTSFFAIVKLGAIAVSVNTLLKPHELSYILRDSRARVLIVHKVLMPALDPLRAQLEHIEHIIVIGGESGQPRERSFAELIAGEASELQAAQTHREDFCSINYSSGTTGEPKGILHAHKDYPLTAQLWGVNVLGLRASDRAFGAPRLFFTFGMGGVLIFPWYAGASTVLMAAPPRIATNVLDTIQRFKPTIHYNAPTGFAALLAHPDFKKYDLSSLRMCVSAGEALPAPIWHAWKDSTGLDIVDGIGSTENYHIFLSNRPSDIRPGSSGKPFLGYELKVVDEQGNPAPQGEIGNLLVKGETAALFYLHQYARSQRTFLGEWMATGDKYYVDEDGYYWHAGRTDDMLKVGGIWVSPVEVESTLLSHPAVLECAVVGQADASGLVKPKAIVVLKDGHSVTAEALVAFCREKMADYKRPRWIEFVDELPKTATGKIQRFRLRVEYG